jgi:hypothetical protein
VEPIGFARIIFPQAGQNTPEQLGIVASWVHVSHGLNKVPT